MKRIKILPVPKEFYKTKSFPLTPEEIQLFLKSMKGYVTPDNYIEDEAIDIETTIRMHSGDSRIWYLNGTYEVLDAKYILMEVDDDGFFENIFDWLEFNIPTLYKKHKK